MKASPLGRCHMNLKHGARKNNKKSSRVQVLTGCCSPVFRANDDRFPRLANSVTGNSPLIVMPGVTLLFALPCSTH